MTIERAIGLRPGRFAVLQAIADNPGISQIELAKLVNRDKATLTPIVQDMNKRGLINRFPDPEDGRSRRLTLTPCGHDLLGHLQDHALRHDARLDDLMTPDDKTALIRLLRKITDGLA